MQQFNCVFFAGKDSNEAVWNAAARLLAAATGHCRPAMQQKQDNVPCARVYGWELFVNMHDKLHDGFIRQGWSQ